MVGRYLKRKSDRPIWYLPYSAVQCLHTASLHAGVRDLSAECGEEKDDPNLGGGGGGCDMYHCICSPTHYSVCPKPNGTGDSRGMSTNTPPDFHTC